MATAKAAPARLRRGGTTYVEIEELAHLIKVTPKTVIVWIRAGMPVAQVGKHGSERSLLDLRAALSWYFSESYERTEHERQKTALVRAQAERTNLDLRVRAGELLEAAEVAREWSDVCGAIRAKLRGIPTKVAPRLLNVADVGAVAATIATEVDDVLKELTDDETRLGTGAARPGDAAVPPPPA